MSYEKELEIGFNAVEKACKLCSEIQQNLVTRDTLTKEDKSPVTVADYSAQAVICFELDKYFPNDPIMAEEDSSDLMRPENETLKKNVIDYANTLLGDQNGFTILSSIDRGNFNGGKSCRFWTLDPIDGTKGFLRNDQYAIALSLIVNGEVVLGILGCPNLQVSLFNTNSNSGSILYGLRRNGSFIQDMKTSRSSRIKVDDITDTKEAAFCESLESSHSSHGDSEKISEVLGVTKKPIRVDSQCKYAIISMGDASIYMRLPTGKDYQEKIWDHAAGYILVLESGGVVTDIHGYALDFSQGRTLSKNTGIIATNGKVHTEVLRAIEKVGIRY